MKFRCQGLLIVIREIDIQKKSLDVLVNEKDAFGCTPMHYASK